MNATNIAIRLHEFYAIHLICRLRGTDVSSERVVKTPSKSEEKTLNTISRNFKSISIEDTSPEGVCNVSILEYINGNLCNTTYSLEDVSSGSVVIEDARKGTKIGSGILGDALVGALVNLVIGISDECDRVVYTEIATNGSTTGMLLRLETDEEEVYQKKKYKYSSGAMVEIA